MKNKKSVPNATNIENGLEPGRYQRPNKHRNTKSSHKELPYAHFRLYHNWEILASSKKWGVQKGDSAP